jgi:hypothetical protein
MVKQTNQQRPETGRQIISGSARLFDEKKDSFSSNNEHNEQNTNNGFRGGLFDLV